MTFSIPFATLRLACAAAVLLHPLHAHSRVNPSPVTASVTDDGDRGPPSDLPEKRMEQVVITAPQMSSPLTVVMDPRAPRQPLPAQDGADFLKTIPGFAVIRKGGSGGDPVMRGMAGSRLNILLDGQSLSGGCPARMDPPTAYITPDAYDRITVIKGPQTVLYGPGNSAGTVLFERNTERRTPSTLIGTSVTRGSYGRRDTLVDFAQYGKWAYGRATLTRSEMNDYRDGSGVAVHSAYRRWSANAALGWMPDDDTSLALSIAQGDGHAAIADRGMDGAVFHRNNIALRFDRRHISPLIARVEAQVYRNVIDHVMDNYSLRPANPRMLMAMNPDRTTEGGRFATTLALSRSNQLIAGFDAQQSTHTDRWTMHQESQRYQTKARVSDAKFSNVGWFAELTHVLQNAEGSDRAQTTEQRALSGAGTGDARLIAGLRQDYWHAEDRRADSLQTDGTAPQRNATLTSGFGRYERTLLQMPMTLFAGLGYTERFPDYWETIARESAASASAFGTKAEKTAQLDFGLLYKSAGLDLNASLFANRIHDYIQIQSGLQKGLKITSITRNIDAQTWGGELGAAYALSRRWTLDGTLAYVRGNNLTDHTALAQIPALESRFGLRYNDHVWSFGTLLRLVAKQDRFDLNKGNIAGQDMEPSAGFGILSLNGGWAPTQRILLSAGVDNLLNKTYAEHLSRNGAALAGYRQTAQINEPGRMIWVQAQFALD